MKMHRPQVRELFPAAAARIPCMKQVHTLPQSTVNCSWHYGASDCKSVDESLANGNDSWRTLTLTIEGLKAKVAYDRVKRKGAAFLTNLFKSRKLALGMKINEDEEVERSTRVETPAIIATSCRRNGSENDNTMSRIPSTLSVTAVDVVVACHPSPSHSILTLTPGRTRNIDQDMEALRLSRQDNPFLQVLASRENLVESIEESESDDAILMSQELGDADPLTLAQVHEHLVRSPPPASWPNSTAFHFPHQDQNTTPSRNDVTAQFKSPLKTPSHRGNEHGLSRSEPSTDIRDRHSHPFSLLHPTPIRSLSEVRRLHRSADDSVQLMSSE